MSKVSVRKAAGTAKAAGAARQDPSAVAHGPRNAIAAPQSAREMAFQVLQRVEKGEAVQAALDQALAVRAAEADARDAALCTEMVYGYLRTQGRLDAVLAHALKAPEKLPAPLRCILRLGVHSLLFLHKVPSHAVLHSCVELAQRKFGKRMGGLANAVLRSVQRLGDDPQHEEFYARAARSPFEARCVFYALPTWIGELWRNAYGDEACRALMARAFAQPWPCVRINAHHEAAHALAAALEAQGGQGVGQHGVAFAPGQTPRQLMEYPLAQWHAQGAFSWQAAGSLAALDGGLADAPATQAWWADAVWDACAGQGGKALALMERGVPVALCSDTHRARLRHLQATAQRLGLGCPSLARMQADSPALRQWNGTILLDAPCSGLGTLARRPEIRQRRTQEHIRALVALQGKMLREAWNLVPSSKHVVYMTCTLNPAENEAQIQALLRAEGKARLVHTWQTAHTHPWLEGMYLAVVQKG